MAYRRRRELNLLIVVYFLSDWLIYEIWRLIGGGGSRLFLKLTRLRTGVTHTRFVAAFLVYAVLSTPFTATNTSLSLTESLYVDQLEDVLTEADVGESVEVDPVLHEACQPVVDVVCKGIRPGEGRWALRL
jgi:hypothetical protein